MTKNKQENFLDKAKNLNPLGCQEYQELKKEYKDKVKENELTEKKQENISISFANGVFNFKSMNDINKFANTIAKSELVPKNYRNKPSDIALCIAKGLELKLHPLTAIDQISVINGRAVMWGDALMSLIQQSGELEWQDMEYQGTRKADDWKCVFLVKRKNREKPVKREFTWIEAKEAGLTTKDNWKKHPDRMLMQRARSYALRDCFPDILGGLYSVEEMKDSKDGKIIDVTNSSNQKKHYDYSDVDETFDPNK